MRVKPVSGHEDAGMGKKSVEYMLEQIPLLKTQAAAQKLEREIELAEEALQPSYAEGPGMTRFCSWRVPMMEERLRILHQKHGLQVEVVRKMEKENEERAREEEQGEMREEMRPQKQRDPSDATYEPQLVDPPWHWRRRPWGAAVAEQQLLQSPRLQEEQQSEDLCACRDNRAQLPPPLLPPPPRLPPPPPTTPPLQCPSKATCA